MLPARREPHPEGAGQEWEEPAYQALRLVARREHTLMSLSELSHELTINRDLFHLADLVLFNLMGQVSTSKAALWLQSDAKSGAPALVRSHGINRQVARALGTSCIGTLIEHLATEMRPAQAVELEPIFGPAVTKLVQRADIAVFAPIHAREEEVLGVLALGRRIGGDLYGSVELQALQAALGMVGVAMQNMIFYNRLLENNRQLRLVNQKLLSLDRLKTEFLSNVNHELRTPLTNVIAYLDCLFDQKQIPESQLEFLGIVMDEAVRLKGLLENLLAFSAISQEKLPIQPIVAEVQPAVAEYYQERLPGVSEGLREFVLECADVVPPARFDKERMLEVLDALVDNAVKFTPEGSRIVLRVKPAVENAAAWVVVEVEDDGPGFPAERIPELMESFRQGDGSSTREIGGMGIGLALARQIAEKMGGRLVVQSQIGKGSTFGLYLPAV